MCEAELINVTDTFAISASEKQFLPVLAQQLPSDSNQNGNSFVALFGRFSFLYVEVEFAFILK